MPGTPDILHAAAQLAQTGTPYVLITVIDTKGHTPRDPGAKMIWRPISPHPISPHHSPPHSPAHSPASHDEHGQDVNQAKAAVGTVGGGQFEQLVLESAQTHYAHRSCGKETFVLGAEAEQCCGGTMEVFYEFVGPRQRLVIFGAGHVSQALVRALGPAGLEITVVDDRPQWNSEKRFPNLSRLSSFPEGVELAHAAPAATLVCVMTCSHETDHEVLLSLLPINAPAYTGLIGSRTKRASFFTRLNAAGIQQSIIERIHCPMGLGDMGKAPELVAVSIAGQILLEAKQLGTL